VAHKPNARGGVFASEDGTAALSFHPTRRQVVVGAGVAVGAAALASTPFLSSLFTTLARVVEPAVGVVAPPSERYPDLLGQLETGVRAGLAAGGQSAAAVIARQSAGSAPSSVAAAARELIEKSKVALVLAYANPTETALLGALAEESGVPVVVVDPGAHIVTSADADSRVLSHSLGYWQSVWSLGAWSAAGAASTAFVISSLYESGFDIATAFGHGLADVGGKVVGTAVTHLPGAGIGTGATDRAAAAAATATAAVAKAVASGAGSIFVAASGSEADDILRAIAKNPAAARLALLVPGLAAGNLSVAPGVSAYTALTWPVGSTSAFAMLGEDIGRLVAAAVAGGAAALPSGTTSLAGARGDITLDLATGCTDVPVTIHSAKAGAKGVALRPQPGATSTAKASAFADDIVASPRTGWIDVYGSAQ
jgi:hypothetical protein